MRADKGKKRTSYSMSYRLLKKQFKDLKRTLEDIEREERRLISREKKSMSRAERRHVARQLLLPPDRVCPLCGEVKIKSKQWVVLPSSGLMCLSCWRKVCARGTGT